MAIMVHTQYFRLVRRLVVAPYTASLTQMARGLLFREGLMGQRIFTGIGQNIKEDLGALTVNIGSEMT